MPLETADYTSGISDTTVTLATAKARARAVRYHISQPRKILQHFDRRNASRRGDDSI